ncbi:MAG: D-2-hydroxyacid dehydrogenase [Bacteroidales bacterium]|nr:D-2-hydroxyacid dehydrogenase [Bacteroidales bacterium]
MKIVCLDGYTLYPAGDARWKDFAEYCDIEVYDRTSPAEIIDRVGDAEMVLTNKVPFDAQTIAALPSLKYIGVLATGYNIVDVAAAARAGITVTNIPSYSTRSVAQQVFALLLAITNRVEEYAIGVAEGKWSSCADFTYRNREWPELAGKTMGIVGFGNIGSAVAAIASAFGMKVALYTSRSQDQLPEGYVKMSLDELFANSDVVSLHCPLTAETRGMVDGRRLALMKPSAILINTGRGPLVDENALATALCEDRLFGAGLDVLTNEPPKPDCPLLSAPNCFITPHVAWASTEARERLFALALGNVAAYLDGNPVNVVSH